MKFDPNEFLYSGNQVYIAEMYERFLDDPHSVDPRWHEFFSDLAGDIKDVNTERRGASWSPSEARVVGNGNTATLSEEMTRGHEPSQRDSLTAQASVQHVSAAKTREATLDSIRALMMIRSSGRAPPSESYGR